MTEETTGNGWRSPSTGRENDEDENEFATKDDQSVRQPNGHSHTNDSETPDEHPRCTEGSTHKPPFRGLGATTEFVSYFLSDSLHFIWRRLLSMTNHADQPNLRQSLTLSFNDIRNFLESSPLSLEREETVGNCGGEASSSSDAVAAAKLAESILRALRDQLLDEALELNQSLKFWTDRYERPWLSWLEAGPMVWWQGEHGYDHSGVVRKVSQIQAVLARRCASIGALQEHLLRAGWRRGVAEWGVLGQGEQWAAMMGGDGSMESSDGRVTSLLSTTNNKESPSFTLSSRLELLPRSPIIGSSHSRSSVFVKNTHGGKILLDDAALASWSVEAVRIIRDQLYRATHFETGPLPFYKNWPQELELFAMYTEEASDDVIADVEEHLRPVTLGNQRESQESSTTTHPSHRALPLWAETRNTKNNGDGGDTATDTPIVSSDGVVVISDLAAMTTEARALYQSMDTQMEVQKTRRLSVLRAPGYLRRSWYMLAAAVPAATFASYWIFSDRMAYRRLARNFVMQLQNFYAEHVSDPLRSILGELVYGGTSLDERITDQKARRNACASLVVMLRDWLDEAYPELPEADRSRMAREMDIGLLEKRKELTLKGSNYGGVLYEIQDIVRMSIIEMQFIKKELMNAMSAIDELMDSNEINFRLGAILPAAMVLYVARGTFRFFWYALLQLGKSREQTYADLRTMVLDIERLLVMRDRPPCPPPSTTATTEVVSDPTPLSSSPDVLDSDDLGMVLLLVHELRCCLRKHQRRFSTHTYRNLLEDLAELTGERGIISIQQQLQIVARMCRSYSVLKVLSVGGVPSNSRRYV